jgi:hypothetical protein
VWAYRRGEARAGELVDGLAETDVTFPAQALGRCRNLGIQAHGRPHATSIASLMHVLRIRDAQRAAGGGLPEPV